MPKFAASLTTLFTEIPMQKRVLAAAEAGFEAVEIPFPYDTPAQDIRNALGFANLPLVLINAPPPNYTGGTAGFAAIVGAQERFRHDFRRALRYAQTLKARHIHVMSGAAWGDQAFDTMVENLRWACAFAPEQSLTIEPMNATDLPGYFLCDFERGAGVIAAVGAENLGLQFDTYHAHMITGNVLESWDKYGGLAHHVQIAGPQGQHEPEQGEIDFRSFFARLDASGYDGWVGADYRPRGRTQDGLGWLADAQAGLGAFKRPA
ncbi:hydroxypyruvate isomerase [Pseudooceanicola sediminis]|uniref:Hydroxypyruvate isomerase n=1 Tax=Pseudooceanicola sediminis TaxID=2211117 RepID=A0A399J4H6_9RHOB|nr:TIM barrel protein [Pseudooceanicola sediminis]KAA2315641.1 TIM barrel protein [Puniceibacterium sp. HSS470]RII40160.1 hydroxypyruvate isomerase [Pseudooceanicola sediminis]|tara:strand:+ start:92864 stop:93652 length:789 start_codon:yes stop_codon:yes gene_type:complete